MAHTGGVDDGLCHALDLAPGTQEVQARLIVAHLGDVGGQAPDHLPQLILAGLDTAAVTKARKPDQLVLNRGVIKAQRH